MLIICRADHKSRLISNHDDVIIIKLEYYTSCSVVELCVILLWVPVVLFLVFGSIWYLSVLRY